MKRKKSVSSRREKRVPASELFITPMRDSEQAELETLAGNRDSEIDYSDVAAMRSVPGRLYVGRFYRPLKQHISLRVDADILARLRGCGKGYQTRINTLLRHAVDSTVPSAIRIRMTEIGVWPKRGVRHERWR
ncbi:MAG TPA: BrnA antitoxin family protein [Terriglobia bacterium]|nr:BrnA antitoxin family protein [Terriglobia bacterium]